MDGIKMEIALCRKDINYPKVMVICAYLFTMPNKKATTKQIMLNAKVVYHSMYQSLITLEHYKYIIRIYEGNKNYIQLTEKGMEYAKHSHKILTLIPHDYSNMTRKTL